MDLMRVLNVHLELLALILECQIKLLEMCLSVMLHT